ncbi:hypothetical protein RA955_00410 [Geobacillus proteiniphilus]|uniref:Mobile element protein n=1 Tax=Geobacillus proteiniphilus TaxID=860353 RepID=A0ABY9MF36_9BACL|nr:MULTISPECIES: hypothetical protein [Geobacillus]WMJ16652.1 hypothetical protein RA955_00410 [Geobacillus proteiniphilus]
MEHVIALFPLSQYSSIQSQAADRKNLSFLLANMEQSLPCCWPNPFASNISQHARISQLARRCARLF